MQVTAGMSCRWSHFDREPPSKMVSAAEKHVLRALRIRHNIVHSRALHYGDNYLPIQAAAGAGPGVEQAAGAVAGGAAGARASARSGTRRHRAPLRRPALCLCRPLPRRAHRLPQGVHQPLALCNLAPYILMSSLASWNISLSSA